MDENLTPPIPPSTSPVWQPGTRMVAGVLLILLAGLLLFELRELLVPLVLSLLLTYILQPIIQRLVRSLKFKRWIAVLVVFLVFLLILAGMTTGIGFAVSEGVIDLANYLANLSQRLPQLIEGLSAYRIEIGPWALDLSEINLDPWIATLTDSLSPILSQTGSLLTSIVEATASFFGTFFAVIILSFYMSLEFGKGDQNILRLIPASHQTDVKRLLSESGNVWRGFLRGQLVLALVIGVSTAVIFSALGVRFALGLGLIAAVLEFVPMFGPILTGLLAVLVALFQTSNHLGVSPLTFAIIVAGASLLIQQIENNILVPRIIGHNLRLSPLVVLLAAFAGGTMAGVLGVLLAAPTVATLRLWLGYVYSKVFGLEFTMSPVTVPSTLTRSTQFGHRLLLRFKKSRKTYQEPVESVGEEARRPGEGEERL